MRLLGSLLVLGTLIVGVGSAGGAEPPQFEPGAAGIGDPYFPLDGNGGYDARHYQLKVRYNPATDVLRGVATMHARATQNLSSFNFDFDGLTVHSITVNGSAAAWSRANGELTVTPAEGLRNGHSFKTVVRYSGIPQGVEGAGFIHTDDGAVVIGEPHVASTWYPVNDHPTDKATYTFKVKVPKGLEAVANGVLKGRKNVRAWTTWIWKATDPMASYLTTATIGQFDLRAYSDTLSDGRTIRYWDAIDPDLFTPAAPRTGGQFAISQKSDSSYKRLTRRIRVPADGATLSFWITRDTEVNWDYAFVEAKRVGTNNWKTLRDLNGHTSRDTGFVCPAWLELHPFLEHYQTANPDGSCSPRGTTGRWHAASGWSGGYEHWKVNLSRWAGKRVRVAISYASDELVAGPGLFVDDIVVSTGRGSTSFEDDGNTRDGWRVPGSPPGSPPNPNDWIVGGAGDIPASWGAIAEASLARQNEILDFQSDLFGPYPFDTAGGIVDDSDAVGFALENQTRPIYSKYFFYDSISGDSVVVHELAHQWYGDSLAVAAWQHIWLNEGFATYAEWLWAEHDGIATAQQIFDDTYNGIPADDPFWALTIGDPGPDFLFDGAVYARGGMTLHALRLAVGDEDFFTILRRWASENRNGNVTTAEFIELAEDVSGQNLDALFDAWLFTPSKPAVEGAAASARRAAGAGATMSLLRHLRR